MDDEEPHRALPSEREAINSSDTPSFFFCSMLRYISLQTREGVRGACRFPDAAPIPAYGLRRTRPLRFSVVSGNEAESPDRGDNHPCRLLVVSRGIMTHAWRTRVLYPAGLQRDDETAAVGHPCSSS